MQLLSFMFTIIAASCMLGHHHHIKLAQAAPLGDWQRGVVANFGGPVDGQDPNIPSGGLLEGACGYGPQNRQTWPNWQVVAISPLAFNATRHPLAGCGACFELRCTAPPCAANTPTLTVQVVDTCADCPANRLVIPYVVFSQSLAAGPAGELDVEYREVECLPPGNVVVDVDVYRQTGGGYVRLALEQVAGSGAVQSVDLGKAVGTADGTGDGAWQRMNNTYGAKWEFSGLPQPPLDLRITGADGQVLIARGAIPTAAPGAYPTSVQFTTTTPTGTGGGVQPALPAAPPTALTSTPPTRPFTTVPSPSPVPSPPPFPSPPAVGTLVINPFMPTSIPVVTSAAPTPPPPPPPSPSPSPPPSTVAVPPTTVNQTFSTPSTPTPTLETAPSPPPPPSSPSCNSTVYDFLAATPELSQFRQNVDAAGLRPALSNPAQVLTVFAPTNEAFAVLPPAANLRDPLRLQQAMLYLVATWVSAPGQSVVPIETLNGQRLTAVQGPEGVRFQDVSSITGVDAMALRSVGVCQSVVILLDQVPLPF